MSSTLRWVITISFVFVLIFAISRMDSRSITNCTTDANCIELNPNVNEDEQLGE